MKKKHWVNFFSQLISRKDVPSWYNFLNEYTCGGKLRRDVIIHSAGRHNFGAIVVVIVEAHRIRVRRAAVITLTIQFQFQTVSFNTNYGNSLEGTGKSVLIDMKLSY